MRTRSQKFGGWEQPLHNCCALWKSQPLRKKKRERQRAQMATKALSTVTASSKGIFLCPHQYHEFNRHRFLSLQDHHHHHHHNTSSSKPRPITSFLVHLEPIGPRVHQHSKPKPKLTRARAADSTQPTTVSSTADKTVVPDDQFSLAKVPLLYFPHISFTHLQIFQLIFVWCMQVSFGVIGLGGGLSLLSWVLCPLFGTWIALKFLTLWSIFLFLFLFLIHICS